MVHAARQPDTALARALLAPLALQLFRVSLGLQLVSAAAVSVSASCPSAPSGMVLRPGHCVGRPCSEAHCDCGSELVKGQCAVSADYAACVKTVAANCSADARPVAPDLYTFGLQNHLYPAVHLQSYPRAHQSCGQRSSQTTHTQAGTFAEPAAKVNLIYGTRPAGRGLWRWWW